MLRAEETSLRQCFISLLEQKRLSRPGVLDYLRVIQTHTHTTLSAKGIGTSCQNEHMQDCNVKPAPYDNNP